MTTPYEIIKQYIIDDTARPDYFDPVGNSVGDRRIQRALQRIHRLDMWRRDLQEQVYVFTPRSTVMPTQVVTGSNGLFMNSMTPPAQYVQQIDLSLLVRYRHICYIRKWQTTNPWGTSIIDPTTGQIGTVQAGDLEERNPDSLFDGYGYDQSDIYYQSGNMINIRSSTPLNQVYIGYFSDPILNPVQNIYSWIAEKYPNLIAAEVKARIFGDIGKDEERKSALLELNTEIASLQTNNIRIALR